MKKFLFCAAAVLALAACNKGDDVEPLTLEEAYACLEGQWISAPFTIEGQQTREIVLLRGNTATTFYYWAGWKAGENLAWELKNKGDGNYSSGTIILTYGPEDQQGSEYRKLKSGSMELCADGNTFVSFTHSPYKTAQEIYDILFNQGKWWFYTSGQSEHNGAMATEYFSRVAEFNKKNNTMELYLEFGFREDPSSIEKTVCVPATSIQLTTNPNETCEGMFTSLPGGDLYPVFMVTPTGFYMRGFAGSGMEWIYMTPAN